MGTTLDSVDIVDVRVDVLAIVAVVEQCYLNGYTVLFRLQTDGVTDDRGAVTVHVTHKFLQTFLGVEHLRLFQIAFFVRTQVGERDGDAGVQVGQFAHTAGNDVVLVLCGSEDASVRPELLTGTCLVGIAYYLHVIEGLALLVFLLVDMTITEHL